MEVPVAIMVIFCLSGTFAIHIKETKNRDLFEGDMKLTSRQRILVTGQIQKRGSTNNTALLWPKTVPYVISPALASKPEAMFAIMQGFREWESYTCLKFIPRPNENNYLYFNTSCGGCWSWVGLQGGQQELCLDSGCWSRATVTHEIAHAMGFWHEQSRPDRDQHVRIVWENINKDNAYNFNLNHHVDSLGSPYDCYSVMQYDETSFSMNGKVTMQPIDRSVVQLGQEVGFTDIDADQANKLYSCNGVTTKIPFPSTIHQLYGADDCTFETSLCHFTQSSKDDFDWTWRIGGTYSWGTGPKVDHTTGRMGRFVYIEASSPRVKGEKARLMSKLFSGKPRCMSFFLHMYSHDATNMGTFNVYLTEKSRNKESIIFTKTGSQGSQWIKYSVTITAKRRYQVAFEGIRGNNYQGDIALDDISFEDGKCQDTSPPPTGPPVVCEDINDREAQYCAKWKTGRLCDSYKDDMKHLCPKTCGICR